MKSLPVVSRQTVLKHRKQILKNPLPFHRKFFNSLGDTFRIKTGRRTTVVFTRDPEVIQHVLQKGHKFYRKSPLQTRDMARYIGHGILTAEGDHWRVHRRMIQPAFHKKKLEGLLGIMHKAIKEELGCITPNKPQDVVPLMGDLAFQVVAKSLFSRSDIRKRMDTLQRITGENQEMLIREMRQPYLKWWFILTGKIGKHLKKAQEARTILNGLVDERIESGRSRDDLLDMLLHARYEDDTGMTRQQLLDEVLILFTAGHETTANALGFILHLLAQNPDWQQAIREEANAFQEDSPISLEDLRKLKKTQAVIEEGLRLYPPVYVIDRLSAEDNEIGALKIPKKTLLLMSIYELHRDPKFWVKPEDFKPERFLNLEKKDYSKNYYPFGAGPRMCVGNNFAMYEMMLVLLEISRKFTIEKPERDLVLNPLISLKPGPIELNFTAID